MAEILGLGITHQPAIAREPSKPSSIRRVLQDPGLPAHLRSPAGWPERMRREWGDDEGEAHGRRHREEIATAIREVRARLDAFQPDFVVVWGDDQYENFREDVVPAFCVLAYESIACRPWEHDRAQNLWGESPDKTFAVKGHQSGAKYLATGLLQESFDVAYAYKPLHCTLGHAFANAVAFLDWDRTGFEYPIVPITVNCLGRTLTAQKGYMGSLAHALTEEQFDPPSPSPARCFDFGAACARTLLTGPWRVALIASSSWSHAFLTRKNYYLYPDDDADRRLYDALIAGDYDVWRNVSTAAVEESGQHEMLNWFCLVGAMAELGRSPLQATYISSSIMNSNKVICSFPPTNQAVVSAR